MSLKDDPPPYSGPPAYSGPPPGVHGNGPAPTGYPYVPPQPQGYYGPPLPQPVYPGYGSTASTVVVTQPDVIIIGACPACRVGVLEDDFTCLGVLCAILFFPLGILCCLALREKRCSNCGASFE